MRSRARQGEPASVGGAKQSSGDPTSVRLFFRGGFVSPNPAKVVHQQGRHTASDSDAGATRRDRLRDKQKKKIVGKAVVRSRGDGQANATSTHQVLELKEGPARRPSAVRL